MRAYLNYFKLRIITNLQYRAAALAGIGTQLFFGLTYIMLYIYSLYFKYFWDRGGKFLVKGDLGNFHISDDYY